MTDIKKDGEDEIPGYAGLSDQKVILKQKQHYANITAARRFLAMGEQRGSIDASEGSARSSVDPAT